MMRCECEKESSSQSPHSPGLVQDDEPIVYALVNPLTGSVKDLSKGQLKAGALSVCRSSYISGHEAKSKTVDVLIQKDNSRTHEGFLYALCAEIRAIRLGNPNVGAFCIIDDALMDYAAHAHIGFSDPSDDKLRNHREAARGNLLLLLNQRGIFTEWDGEPFAA